MNILEQHEVFEIEVLQRLKSAHLLNPLVFGGGTMLRLCHGLNRYSADLDLWFIKRIDYKAYQLKLTNTLNRFYEITDNQLKHYSLLFEARSAQYPKKLKIEIWKFERDCDFQDSIAYSTHSNIQVILRTHTLQQTIVNKFSALIDRNEIRDAFDIEFLLRKGINIPPLTKDQKKQIVNRINQFKDMDYKVKLGSIIDDELRGYYIKNKFSFLQSYLKNS